MTLDEKIEALPHDIKVRLLKTHNFIPRLSLGHGSLKIGKCNVVGCIGEGSHFQDRVKSAYFALGLDKIET